MFLHKVCQASELIPQNDNRIVATCVTTRLDCPCKMIWYLNQLFLKKKISNSNCLQNKIDPLGSKCLYIMPVIVKLHLSFVYAGTCLMGDGHSEAIHKIPLLNVTKKKNE